MTEDDVYRYLYRVSARAPQQRRGAPHPALAFLPHLRARFAGPADALRWFQTARPASLGGRLTPEDLLHQGRHAEVLALLDQLGRDA